ncbi:hypothetical protein QL285_095994 [Trifolium repens]|nr:hypothetical protein QL285_095994 [Trifolium repens]
MIRSPPPFLFLSYSMGLSSYGSARVYALYCTIKFKSKGTVVFVFTGKRVAHFTRFPLCGGFCRDKMYTALPLVSRKWSPDPLHLERKWQSQFPIISI